MPFRFVVPVLILSAGLAIAEWTVRTYREQQQRRELNRVLVCAAEVRARLESALNSTVFLARGLGAYVAGVERPSESQVSKALKALHDSDPRIRNVGLAPRNRLTFIYPVKGNEPALGLQYEENPAQWPSVRKAIETRQPVLAGPVQLVQGGTAIINRTPIFLADGRYWGVISTAIDLSGLLADVGLAEEIDGVRYWLYGDNGDERIGAKILGEGAAPARHAIRMTVEVPGGHWLLVGSPVEQGSAVNKNLLGLRAGLYLAAGLLATLAFVLMRGRAAAVDMAAKLRALNEELSCANRELHELSRHDPLTGLPNRRLFEETLEKAWSAAMRSRTSLSILMIDIDRFKSINDTYGHAAGDATLLHVAAAIRARLARGSDMVARYGGEEFIVLTVDQDAAEVAALAERIRAGAAECSVQQPADRTPGDRITVSIGTATTTPKPGELARALVQRADEALYVAKTSGRNRVSSAEIENPAPKEVSGPSAEPA
jgi:diguanylate cyclase (GGDEF)-like protein